MSFQGATSQSVDIVKDQFGQTNSTTETGPSYSGPTPGLVGSGGLQPQPQTVVEEEGGEEVTVGGDKDTVGARKPLQPEDPHAQAR